MGWGVSGCGCGCGVVLFRYVCESGVRARVSGMIMYLLIHDKSAKITNVKRSELLAASKTRPHHLQTRHRHRLARRTLAS